MPLDDGLAETPEAKANRLARYNRIKEANARLDEIDEEVKALGQERSKITKELEKEEGVNRGGLSDARRYAKLSPAAAEKRRETFEEMWRLEIQPKIDEAVRGQADE